MKNLDPNRLTKPIRQKMYPRLSFRAQIKEDADLLAQELHRMITQVHANRNETDRIKFASWEIERLLDRYEEFIEKAVDSNGAKPSPLDYTEFAKQQFRIRNIRTRRSWLNGCDTCYGSESAPAFLELSIGSWKGRLCLNLCRSCSIRLLNVVEARFEDKRVKDAG